MNQTLYLISEDLFTNPNELIPSWGNLIKNKCISEKAVLVYDPVCGPIFQKMIHDEKSLKHLVMEYYQYFHNNCTASLKWGEIDYLSVQYIDYISELLYELEDSKLDVVAFGCMPVFHDKYKMYLFFYMNTKLKGEYSLISEKKFLENYQLILDTEAMLKG